MLKNVMQVIKVLEAIPVVQAVQVVDYSVFVYFTYDKTRNVETYAELVNSVVTLTADPREALYLKCAFDTEKLLKIMVEWS